MSEPIDCVVLGHRDTPFEQILTAARAGADRSGFYGVLRCNSVLVDGQRVTYEELWNRHLGELARLSTWSTLSFTVVALTGYLERRGLRVEPVSSYDAERERFHRLLARSPRAVAITTTFYFDDEPIRQLVEEIRERSPSSVVIVGGPRVQAICQSFDEETQDFVLEEMGVDIAIHDAHGEQALGRVVAALRDGRAALPEIENLIYRDADGVFHRTARCPEVPDLTVPVEWARFGEQLGAGVCTRTSTSCAFRCAFCKYHTMAGPHRLIELTVVERELAALRELGVARLHFVDDSFNVPLPRFKELLRLLARFEPRFRWTALVRCSSLDEEAMDLMKESGCEAVFLGIESGSPEVLRNMNKKAGVDRYRHGIRGLESRGIITAASLIVGFPGETAATVDRTIELIEETAPTFYRAELFFLDSLAPVDGMRETFGLSGQSYTWSHATMGWREGLEQIARIYRTVTRSLILPLYSFDLESVTLLSNQGVAFSTVRGFLEVAHQMLVRGLDDRAFEAGPYLRRLDELGRPVV